MEKRTEAQSRALQDVQNEFVESRREQNRFQEKFIRKEKALRDTQIGSELSSPRVSSDKSSELSAHQTRIRGSCGVFLRAELIKSFSEACEDFYSELSAHQIPVRSLRRVFLRAEPPSNAYPRLVGVLLRAEFSSNPSERGTQQPPRLVLGSCAFSLSLGLTTPASWADSHCELRSRRGVLRQSRFPIGAVPMSVSSSSRFLWMVRGHCSQELSPFEVLQVRVRYFRFGVFWALAVDAAGSCGRLRGRLRVSRHAEHSASSTPRRELPQQGPTAWTRIGVGSDGKFTIPYHCLLFEADCIVHDRLKYPRVRESLDPHKRFQ